MNKWYAIAMVVFFVCMFGSFAFEDYNKFQCRTEALRAGKSVEDVQKLCK